MKNWSWKIISSQTYYKATVIKTMCYLLKSPASRSSIDFFFLSWNVIVYINVVCVSGGFILFHWQSSKQNLFISIRNIERDKKAEYGPSVVSLSPPHYGGAGSGVQGCLQPDVSSRPTGAAWDSVSKQKESREGDLGKYNEKEKTVTSSDSSLPPLFYDLVASVWRVLCPRDNSTTLSSALRALLQTLSGHVLPCFCSFSFLRQVPL